MKESSVRMSLLDFMNTLTEAPCGCRRSGGSGDMESVSSATSAQTPTDESPVTAQPRHMFTPKGIVLAPPDYTVAINSRAS